MTYNDAVLIEQALWLLDVVDDDFFWADMSDVRAAQDVTERGPGKPFQRRYAGVIH